MTRKDREAAVETLSKNLKEAESLFLTHYQGLTVAELDDLRSKLAPLGGEYRVVKNTLTKRALDSLGLSEFAQNFEGPSGLVIERGDPIPVAKVLSQFMEEHEKLQIRAGYLSGQVLTAKQIRELAKVPPKPVLLQRMVSSLHSPLYRLVRTLNEPICSLVRVLQSFAQKKEAEDPKPAS